MIFRNADHGSHPVGELSAWTPDFLERLAIDEVEHESGLAIVDVEVADADDPRVGDTAQRGCFENQATSGSRVGHDDRMEPLDGDRVARSLVGRTPDGGRSAGSERLLEAVSAEEHRVSHGPRVSARGAAARGSPAAVA